MALHLPIGHTFSMKTLSSAAYQVIFTLIQNQSLNKFKPDTPTELTWMLRERDRLAIQDGILYRRRMVEDSEKLVLPTDDAKSGSS